jgi:tetratricopeptide (TPR) repeat protein
VAVAGVGLVALVIVLATLTGGLFVVRSQRNLAREAERDALLAQGNEARARADAEDVLDYFIEVFSAAQGDRLGHDVTVLEAVKTTAEGIDERFAERPRVAARIHNSAGNLFRVLGEIRLAERHHARAVEIMRGLDEPDLGTELIFIHDYAIVFDDLGEFDRFREMIEQAHARGLRLLGPNHKATLMLSASLVGNIWVETGQYEEAMKELPRLLGQQGLDRETYLTTLGALGSAQSRTARLDEAKETFERIIREGDPKRDLRHILAARNNLAGIHFQSGELEPALEQYLEIESVLANRFGEKSQRHLVVLNNIAAAQQELGLLDDAWATRDKADVLAQEILPAGHAVFARLLEGRAGLLAEMGRHEEAIQAFLEVRRLFEAAQGVPESMLRANASDLARVYRMMERPDEAAKWSALAGGEGGT